MESISSKQINSLLTEISRRYANPATLTLLGASALCLLGSNRPTFDIDYVGDDLRKNELQQTIERVAQELRVPVEAVPIEQFVPIPAGADERRLLVGRFGKIDVYVLDPYTIALSKLDRGFDSDLDDILFLIRRNYITLPQLELIVVDALKRAHEFDLIAADVRAHLQTVRTMLD